MSAKEIESILVKVGVEIKSFEKGFDLVEKRIIQTKSKIQSMASSLQSIGQSLALKVTAPLAIMGGVAVKTFVDYEKAILRAKAVTNATGKEFENLQKTAKNLGATTQFSAGQAAEALANLGQLGLNANKAILAVPNALNLAAAGSLGLEEAATITANAMNSMGLSAEETTHLVDVLANAATKSGANVSEIGFALTKVGSVAKVSGQKMETVIAAIGLLRDRGIDAGTAGTELRNMFIRLSKAQGKSAQLMKQYGIEVKDTEGNLKQLPDLVQSFSDKLGHLSAPDKIAVLSNIMDARTAAAFLSLMDAGADRLRVLDGQLSNVKKTAAQLAEEMMGGLGGTLIALQSTIEGAMISAIEVLKPALNDAAKAVTSLFKAFIDMSPAMKSFILTAALVAGALGPMLIGLALLLKILALSFGSFSFFATGATMAAKGLSLFVSIMTKASFKGLLEGLASGISAFKAFGIAAIGSAMKIAAIIAPLLLLINLAVSVARNWDDLSEITRQAWENMKSMIGKAVDSVANFLFSQLDLIKEYWVGVWNSMGLSSNKTWKKIVTFISQAASDIGNWIKDKIVGGINNLIGAYNAMVGVFGVGKEIKFIPDFKALTDTTIKAWDDVVDTTIKGGKALIDKTSIAADAIKTGVMSGFSTFSEETKKNLDFAKNQITSFAKDAMAGLSFNFGGDQAGAASGGSAGAQTGGGDTGGGLVESLTAPLVAYQEYIRVLNAEQDALTANNAIRLTEMSTQWFGFTAGVGMMTEELKMMSQNLFSSMSSGFSSAISGMLLEGKTFQEVMGSLWKQLASIVIQALVKIALQQVATAAISATAQKSASGSKISSLAGETFAAFMASMGAAPWPVNMTAPAIASGMAAGALAGGMSFLGSAESGGIISEHGFLEVGELGKKEAIVPLEGNMAGRGGSTSIIVEIDSQVLMDIFVEKLPETLRLKTGSSL